MARLSGDVSKILAIVVIVSFSLTRTIAGSGEEIRFSSRDAQSVKSFNNARAIAVGSDRIVHVVWSELRDDIDEIRYRRSGDLGLTWGKDAVMARDPNFTGGNPHAGSSCPALTVSGPKVYVVWVEDGGSDMAAGSELFFRRSADAGLSWEETERLTRAPGQSVSPSIAASGNEIHLIWTDLRNDGIEEIYYKCSRDEGRTWSDDLRLTESMSLKGHPVVSTAGNAVHCFWMDMRDGNWEIYCRRSIDGGRTWFESNRLTDDPGMSEVPSAVAVGDKVYVVWEDTRDSPTGEDYEIYFKRSTDGGQVWSEDIRLTRAARYSLNPFIDISGDDIYVAWQDRRDGEEDGRIPDHEIYLKSSTDGGENWSPDMRLTFEPSNSVLAAVAATPSSVLVLWVDYREGGPQVYFKSVPISSLPSP